MLTIRMQRTGRSGHAQFRLIVQDSQFSPTSGRVVAYLGSFNPHTKEVVLNKEKAEQYLANGAQPSPKLIKILKDQGVKLPEWVKEPTEKKGEIRNPEKLRKNRSPDAEPVEASAKPKAEAAAVSEPPAEPAENTETPAEESAAEGESPVETPAEEASEEPAGGTSVEEVQAEKKETAETKPVAETPAENDEKPTAEPKSE